MLIFLSQCDESVGSAREASRAPVWCVWAASANGDLARGLWRHGHILLKTLHRDLRLLRRKSHVKSPHS